MDVEKVRDCSLNLYALSLLHILEAATKTCSENMQQNYRRISMPKCDFNKVALHCFATLLKSHFSMGILL